MLAWEGFSSPVHVQGVFCLWSSTVQDERTQVPGVLSWALLQARVKPSWFLFTEVPGCLGCLGLCVCRCCRGSQVGQPKSLDTSARLSPAQNYLVCFFFFVVNDIAKKIFPSYIYEVAVCDSVILMYSVWLLVWWEEVLRMWQNRKHEKEPGCVWPSPAGGGADAAPTAGCAEICWTTGISRSLLTLFHCCSQP